MIVGKSKKGWHDWKRPNDARLGTTPYRIHTFCVDSWSSWALPAETRSGSTAHEVAYCSSEIRGPCRAFLTGGLQPSWTVSRPFCFGEHARRSLAMGNVFAGIRTIE